MQPYCLGNIPVIHINQSFMDTKLCGAIIIPLIKYRNRSDGCISTVPKVHLIRKKLVGSINLIENSQRDKQAMVQ